MGRWRLRVHHPPRRTPTTTGTEGPVSVSVSTSKGAANTVPATDAHEMPARQIPPIRPAVYQDAPGAVSQGVRDDLGLVPAVFERHFSRS